MTQRLISNSIPGFVPSPPSSEESVRVRGPSEKSAPSPSLSPEDGGEEFPQAASRPLLKTVSQVWPALLEVLHPLDRPPPATWPMCYETKFALARLLQPRRLLEIGVRTGYSALAFLLAVPEASYLGIDANRETHGGFRGAIGHARRVLEPFQAEVREQTSADYTETLSPVAHAARFDLIHIDGDHSLSGCSFDLRLARRIGGRHVLVDDYGAIPEVRDACDQFCHEFADEYTRIAVDDGHHGAVLFTKSDAFPTAC